MNTTDREIKHQDGQITSVFHVTMPKFHRGITVDQHQRMIEEYDDCRKIMAGAKRSYLIAIDKIEKGLPAQSDVVFAEVSEAKGDDEVSAEFYPSGWDKPAPKPTFTQIRKRIDDFEKRIRQLSMEVRLLKSFMEVG